MTKGKVILLSSIALIAILLSFLGGQAYAKNMSRITGRGSADMADWSFKVNEKEDQIQTISLKSTINNSSLVSNKIAPGTKGDFQIKLDGTGSEVGINYIIRFENESKKPKNLKFSYDNKTYNSLTELQEVLTGAINADDQDKIKELTIGWSWDYETGNTEQEILASDIVDTQDAKQMTDYTFDIIVSGTQIMPEN